MCRWEKIHLSLGLGGPATRSLNCSSEYMNNIKWTCFFFFCGGNHSWSGGWIRVHDVRVPNNQQNIEHFKMNSVAFYYVLFMYVCLLYVHVCVCMHPWCACGSQRTTVGNQLSLSIPQVSGTEVRLSVLLTSALTHGAISPAFSGF